MGADKIDYNFLKFMEKKNILIWQSGEPLQIDPGNHNPMRAICLSEYYLKKNFNVTLVSANFDHTNKIFRFKGINKFKIIRVKKNFNIVLINSTGYKKNIGLPRLIDHFLLAFNLKFFLENYKEKIDFAVIGFPPIEPSIVLSNWLSSNKIPYIFDIKDLWPEYFYVRIKNKAISFLIKLFFSIHNIFLKKSLNNCSGITTNNKYFLKFILKKIKKKKSNNDQVIYLTKSLLNVKSRLILKKINYDKKKFNIYFCGRLNLEIFDFKTVVKSLSVLKTKKLDFHFYIGGYGEIKLLKKLINKFDLDNNISLLGFIDKYSHSVLLKESDCFIAPFYNNMNFSSNLSNKFIESIQYNLPILTPLKKDVATFILKNKIGNIYKENNYLDLAKKIEILINNPDLIKSMQRNLKKLSRAEFDHDKNYSKFLSINNNC